MLNDLAEAMKALEGKKSRHSCNRYPEGGTSTPRYKLDQSTTRDNPRGREGKEDGERNQNKGGQTTTEATGPTQAQRGTQQKPGGQREAPTRTATLCPLEWPSNYNLLRLWHTPKSFHQYAAQLKQQVQHQHMFTSGRSTAELASRVLFQRPAHFFPSNAFMASASSNDQLITYRKRFCNSTCESASSLTGNCAGEHQTMTWHF